MKSLKTQNYYDVLGVSRFATPEEIRSAYEISRHTFQENSLATYSLFSDQENQEILALIAKAFETLFNPETRRAYDAVLSQQEGEAAPAPRRGTPSGGAAAAGPTYATQPGLQSVAGQAAPARIRPEADAARRAAAGVSASPAGGAARSPASPVSVAAAAAASPAGGAARSAVSPVSVATAAPQSPKAPPSSPTAQSSPGANPPASGPKPAPVSEVPPPNPARDEFLKTVTRFDGAVLKKLRQISGVTLEEMAERSKIRKAYLEYIEEENFQFLPAPVYVKGFVTLMANILGAPAQRAAEDYMLVVRAKRHGS